MHALKIGARVSTKYGPGTIGGFERIEHVNMPIVHPSEFETGDRIEVLLDNPFAWPLSYLSEKGPYFAESELTVI